MNNTIYTHGVDASGKHFTLAATLVESSSGPISINYGVSICRKGENFSKKLGRIISEGKAKVDPISVLKITSKDENLIKIQIKEKLFGIKASCQNGTVDQYMKRNR